MDKPSISEYLESMIIQTFSDPDAESDLTKSWNTFIDYDIRISNLLSRFGPQYEQLHSDWINARNEVECSLLCQLYRNLTVTKDIPPS